MNVPLLRKVLGAPSRKKVLEAKIKLRKSLNEQRARMKKKNRLAPFIKNGERAVLILKENGVNSFTLRRLKTLEKALNLEIINFDKELGVELGGNWGRALDSLTQVRKRIKELEQ